jgi:hypothetical protein
VHVPTHIARRSLRHRLRVRVTTSRGSSFTVNVSTGGFCTELMRVLSVGDHLEGLIHLGGRDASFAGRVAWAREGDARLNLRGRMGVCFVQIDPLLARGLAACEEHGAAASL